MFEIQHYQKTTMIKLYGEISLLEKESIFKLIDSMNEHGLKRLILNFSDVTHIHYKVVCELITKAIFLKEDGGQLVISDLQDKVKEVFIFAKAFDDLRYFNHFHEAIFNFVEEEINLRKISKDEKVQSNYFDDNEIKYLRH